MTPREGFPVTLLQEVHVLTKLGDNLSFVGNRSRNCLETDPETV